MSKRPTLILPADPNGVTVFKTADGNVVPFSAEIHARELVDIVLPGQMVRIYTHDLPKMREREKQAAARFAIEDKTGASVDGQHIVLGGGADNRLAVVETNALRGVISGLENEDVQIGDIYADFDWLSPQETPLIFPDRIIFTGAQGYTIDPEWADDDLKGIAPSTWDELRLNDNALSLRSGEFSRRSGLKLPVASFSKIAAVFTLTGLSWLALQWADSRALTQQARDLQMQTAALYTQATGDAAPANPALVVTRAVKTAPAVRSDFIPLMSALNAALGQTNNIEIQTVTYDVNKAQLSLRLIYPSFESAGELEAAANAAGHSFRAGGVRERNGILVGDAVFEIGSPS